MTHLVQTINVKGLSESTWGNHNGVGQIDYLTIKTGKGNGVYRPPPLKFRISYKWSSINIIANQIPWWRAEKKMYQIDLKCFQMLGGSKGLRRLYANSVPLHK